MDDYSEIYRYMGHKGAADARLEALVASSVEKLLAVCAPNHVTVQLPCSVSAAHIKIDALDIESAGLAACLRGCTQAYIFAATLGADVDRLIARRSKIDSAEALCMQACAAAQIERYCNAIEQELSRENNRRGLYLRPRFSPGYGDFAIAHQTDILRILQAHKRIGLCETKTHMLTPLKSVTALIGIGPDGASNMALDEAPQKCAECDKTDCSFQDRGKV